MDFQDLQVPALEEKLVKIKNHLFILSAPRSGSTLLRVILNKIPDVVSPPETYFLEFYRNNKELNPAIAKDREILVQRWLDFRNHLNQRNLYDRQAFKSLVLNQASTWADIFSALIQLYARDAGKTFSCETLICEKTPLHIEFQDELRELFPEAKIVFLIRDPRDVVASLKTCPWGPSSIIANSRYWCLTTDLIQASDNSILVKFEELLDNPEAELVKISALLNLNVREDILYSEAPNEEKESIDPKNMASFKPIDNSFKGKWKDILSEPDKELEVIENICYERMLRFAYCPSTPKNKRLYRMILFQNWMEKQYKRVYRRLI